MKFVVIGHAGYVGPVLLEHLRQTWPDSHIVGVDAGFFADCVTAPAAYTFPAIEERRGDARDVDAAVLADADAVLYLAAVSNDPMGERFAAPTLEINRDAAVDWARAAKRTGVPRFVFASSCSVYGAADEGARTEQSPVAPLTAYARSKVEAETALAGLADDNFQVTSLRFSTACGMSPRLRLDLVLNDFVACALSTGTIRILSDGTPWRPLIDVHDMARAFAWAASTRTERPWTVLNVGANQANYQVVQIARCVADAIPGTTVAVNPDAQPDRRSYRVDFSAFARQAPDAVPKWTLEDSVRDVAAGLRAIGFADSEFRQSRLIRLNVLRAAIDAKEIGENLRRA